MKGRIDKKVWGVLGKQQTYFSPQKQIEGKTKTPLNANAFDSWDAKRSRFKRVDGYENQVPNHIQQHGVVPQDDITPTPSNTQQPTPTPSITPTMTETPTNTPTLTTTPTNTNTPSLTPSSTPYPIIQPSLWFDASDSSTMNLILSGGTTYISQLTSKGTEAWTLTGSTSDRYPTYSASTFLPGSPQIIRFTPNTTAGLRQGLVSFGNTSLPHSGATVFIVFASPVGTLAFGAQIYSGLTNGNMVVSGANPTDRITHNIASNLPLTNTFPNTSNSSTITPPISAASINSKYLVKQNLPWPTGFSDYEINQSGGTSTTSFTGTTITPQLNAIFLGGSVASGGTQTFTNNNIEFCEYMFFNRTLTPAEQEAVELYLKDKWRYDEWASPVPTPTQTNSPTPSITPTLTNTPTNTTTNTPTPSTTPPASGTSEAQTYLRAVVDGGGTGITSTVSAATTTLFTSLYSNNLWNKITAFYPMLGGNSSGCKFNGKNPVDTDAGYRLVFNGGWTFDASGATSNGSNAFANSFLSASTITPLNSQHLSIYLGSNVAPAAGKTYAGAASSVPYYFVIGQDGTPRYFYGVSDNGILTSTTPNTQGNLTISSSGGTNSTLYKNGTLVHNGSNSNGNSIPHSIYFGAMNNAGTAIQFYNNQFRFATIGGGLTAAEVSTLSTIINTFQTSIGRNTY